MEIDNLSENQKSDSISHKLDLLCLASEVSYRKMVTAECEFEHGYYKRIGFKLSDAMDSIAFPELDEMAQSPVLDLQAIRLASDMVRVHISQMQAMIEAVATDLNNPSDRTMHWPPRSHHQSLLSVSL